jgi:hypothetical protein
MTPDIDHAAISAPLTGPGWGFSPITGTIEDAVLSWFSEPRNRGTDYSRAQREVEIIEAVKIANRPRSHKANAELHRQAVLKPRTSRISKKAMCP